jgi:outer membrane protein TolC
MAFVLILFLMGAHARAQSADPNAPLQFARPRGPAAPPALITLQDALARARDIDVSVQLARAEALIAREEVRQAEAELRPSVAYTTDYIGTQGNGVTPNGRYVGADGVHVYRSGLTVHQEVSAHTLLKTGFLRAGAARALADAKAEIAQRGLDFTVSKRYYALVEAQRRYATAQQAVQQVQRFVDVTQQRETAGEAAHSDVVKAQIQLQQQRRAFQDAGLAIENTRLDLAVLLSTNIDENFSVVDDLDMPKNLPSFDELQAMAEKENPDLKAADASFRLASSGVRGARNALLPSLSIDGHYGIEANAFKRHSTRAEDPSLGGAAEYGLFLHPESLYPCPRLGCQQKQTSCCPGSRTYGGLRTHPGSTRNLRESLRFL